MVGASPCHCSRSPFRCGRGEAAPPEPRIICVDKLRVSRETPLG